MTKGNASIADYKQELMTMQELISQSYLPYQKGVMNLVDAVLGRYEDILLSVRKLHSGIAQAIELQQHSTTHIAKLLHDTRHPMSRSQGLQDFSEAIRIIGQDIEELIRLITEAENSSSHKSSK
jgi:hypothetical protein